MTIQLTYSGKFEDISSTSFQEKLTQIQQNLHKKVGAGSEFLGWHDWPSTMTDAFLNEMSETAREITSTSDVLIVIGIGGSYLGSKAVMEALSSYFKATSGVEVIFAGHHVSGEYLANLMEYVENKEVSINVISKSGTTTEPALAFRFLQNYMEKRYGAEAANRIYVTTDAEKGSLLHLAEEKGYKRFVVPATIGGRYSVFTAVGLLPIAAAGYDVEELMRGAKDAEQLYGTAAFSENTAMQYAAARNYLYSNGFEVEILATFDAKLAFVQEWWKQLFGESEGKDGKGIFPASVSYTTDLHSLGQYIQDGRRFLFETFLNVAEVETDLEVFVAENNGDELNYLAGLSLHDFNKVGYEATSNAHLDGGVPQLALTIQKLDEYHLGELLYFFMISCAYSAYLLEINPFDQPGVEAYKTNIFKLLKKPGY